MYEAMNSLKTEQYMSIYSERNLIQGEETNTTSNSKNALGVTKCEHNNRTNFINDRFMNL